MSLQAEGCQGEKRITPPCTSVVHSWLTTAAYQQLKNAAARRGEHPDRLSAMILNSVLQNDLTDAVIDGFPASS